MLEVLAKYNLVPSLIQLFAAFIALFAVIYTQYSFNKRQKQQQEHEKIQKKRELQLQKIEEIFELTQDAREEWADFLKYLMEQDEVKSELNVNEVNQRIDEIKKRSRVSLKKIDLLTKIYISEDLHLCVFWEESMHNIRNTIITNNGDLKQINEQVGIVTHHINLILNKLVEL